MDTVTADVSDPIRMSLWNTPEEAKLSVTSRRYGLGEAMVSRLFFRSDGKPIVTGDGWCLDACLKRKSGRNANDQRSALVMLATGYA